MSTNDSNKAHGLVNAQIPIVKNFTGINMHVSESTVNIFYSLILENEKKLKEGQPIDNTLLEKEYSKFRDRNRKEILARLVKRLQQDGKDILDSENVVPSFLSFAVIIREDSENNTPSAFTIKDDEHYSINENSSKIGCDKDFQSLDKPKKVVRTGSLCLSQADSGLKSKFAKRNSSNADFVAGVTEMVPLKKLITKTFSKGGDNCGDEEYTEMFENGLDLVAPAPFELQNSVVDDATGNIKKPRQGKSLVIEPFNFYQKYLQSFKIKDNSIVSLPDETNSKNVEYPVLDSRKSQQIIQNDLQQNNENQKKDKIARFWGNKEEIVTKKSSSKVGGTLNSKITQNKSTVTSPHKKHNNKMPLDPRQLSAGPINKTLASGYLMAQYKESSSSKSNDKKPEITKIQNKIFLKKSFDMSDILDTLADKKVHSTINLQRQKRISQSTTKYQNIVKNSKSKVSLKNSYLDEPSQQHQQPNQKAYKEKHKNTIYFKAHRKSSLPTNLSIQEGSKISQQSSIVYTENRITNDKQYNNAIYNEMIQTKQQKHQHRRNNPQTSKNNFSKNDNHNIYYFGSGIKKTSAFASINDSQNTSYINNHKGLLPACSKNDSNRQILQKLQENYAACNSRNRIAIQTGLDTLDMNKLSVQSTPPQFLNSFPHWNKNQRKSLGFFQGLCTSNEESMSNLKNTYNRGSEGEPNQDIIDSITSDTFSVNERLQNINYTSQILNRRYLGNYKPSNIDKFDGSRIKVAFNENFTRNGDVDDKSLYLKLNKMEDNLISCKLKISDD